MSFASQTSAAAIVCNLDALTPEERSRRSDLARAVQALATGVSEWDAGFRIALPNEAGACAAAVELILLERRCCPFLTLELGFEPGDGAVHLGISGPPGVKQFLRENGILGCAQPGPGCSGGSC